MNLFNKKRKILVVNGCDKTTVEAETNLNTLVLIKVGNDDRPAIDDDIKSVADAIALAIKNNESIVVTHHAIKTEIIKF